MYDFLLKNKENKTNLYWFENVDLFVEKKQLLDFILNNCCFYLKASHGMHFAKIIDIMPSIC